MNKILIKGFIAILFGLAVALVSGNELANYYTGSAIEFSSSRHGTLTSMSAISYQVGGLIGGIAFVIWGVYLVKDNNKNT